jgi:hypothetical protein
VLFYGCNFWKDFVEFAIVTEHDPSALPHDGKPLIISRVMRKPASLTVMVFDGERRIRSVEGFREAAPTISIKIECQ